MKSKVWALLAVAVAICWTLLPMYWFLKAAFETIGEMAHYPPYFFPPYPQPGAFFNILGFPYHTGNGIDLPASGQAGQVILGIRNSIIIAVVVTILTMVFVVPLAYVFARLEFAHKNMLLGAVLLAASLPPVSTLIPFYSLYVQLDLVGTIPGLVIVTLTITIPFVTWMLIGFFRNLPPVEQLARIDGFSRLYTLVFVVIPMARSGVTVAAIIAFLFSWNEFVYASVLVTGEFVEALLVEGSLELAKAFVDEGFHVLRGCKEPIRLFSVTPSSRRLMASSGKVRTHLGS